MTLKRSGVAALVFTDGKSTDLAAVLAAVDSQTMAPDSVLIVDASASPSTPLDDLPEGVEVVRTPGAANLGRALSAAMASDDLPDGIADARWWWLLHDDSAPEASCLAEQWEIADRGRTIGAVGPKQLDWDGEGLLEVGVLATRSARRLERTSIGEIDQGQYDSTSDVLAVGTVGMLLDPSAWRAVGGFDSALGPFGDGLDFGRRLHRAGFRVVVAPKARIRHRRASLAAPALVEDATRQGEELDAAIPEDEEETPSTRRRGRPRDPRDASFRARRFAQIYNWFKATPAPLLPLLALWMVVWTPVRALARDITGMGHLAGAEMLAWGDLILATPHLIAARFRAHRAATVPSSALRALETSPRALSAQRSLNRRIARGDGGGNGLDSPVAASRRSYRVNSALTLAGLVIVALIGAIAAWWGAGIGLAGAAWTTLPATWTDLWEAAWASWIPGGDGQASPADPILVILALISWPFHFLGITATSLVMGVTTLAGVLSVLVMWPLTRRLTSSLPMRAAGALLWSVLPALTISQYQGRIGAVLIHLALPVLVAAWVSILGFGSPLRAQGATEVVLLRPRPRTGAFGVFALAGAVIAACAPWTAILLLLLVVVSVKRIGRGAVAMLVAAVPALLLIAPIVGAALSGRAWRALTTVGGGAYASEVPASWQLVLGLPGVPSWRPLAFICLAPMTTLILWAVVALARRLGRGAVAEGNRPIIAAWLFAGAAAMIVVAEVLVRIPVAVVDGRVATAWASPALSFAGLALIGVILVLVPAHLVWDAPAMRRAGRSGAVLVLVAVAVMSGPILARLHNAGGDSGLDTVDLAESDHVVSLSSPQISAVSDQAQQSVRAGRVLVLEAVEDLSEVEATVWRGVGDAMTDESAVTRALAVDETVDAAATDLASLALTLVVYPDAQTVARLADHGIDTILVPTGTEGRPDLVEALNRAPGLERVGETDAGSVWRLRPSGLQPSRVRILTANSWRTVASTNLLSDTVVEDAVTGTLVLAERADPGWSATLDGVELTPVEDSWYQAFEISGEGRLVIEHTAWWRLPWTIAALASLGISVLLAIPFRRRRHD